MKTISNFKDYRDFILFKFNELKDSPRKMSYQKIATDLGTTKSYLKLVTDKKRHISIDKAIPLAKYFKLPPFETQYFIFLFLQRTAKNIEIKNFFSSILSSYLAFSRSEKSFSDLSVHPERKSINRNWSQMAILCLSAHPDFKGEASWIHHRLGGKNIISIEAVEKSFTSLLDQGFICRTEDGFKPVSRDFVQHVDLHDAEDYQRFVTGLNRTEMALRQKTESALHRPNRHQMYCMNMSADEASQVMRLYDDLENQILAISKNSISLEKTIFISNNAFSVSI